MDFICGQSEELTIQEARDRVKELNINHLLVSKVDDMTLLVSKNHNKINIPFINEEKIKLEKLL